VAYGFTLAVVHSRVVLQRLTLVAAGLLLAGAAIELALALGAAKPGPEPGDDATGQAVVGPTMFVAFVVGIGAAAVGRKRVAALLAPAAALLVTVGFYTYDPYYAPSLRRYSDGGAVAPSAIFVMLAVSLGVGLATWRWPRRGGLLTAFALVFCGLVGLAAGDGH
jgi:hypothetical protein